MGDVVLSSISTRKREICGSEWTRACFIPVPGRGCWDCSREQEGHKFPQPPTDGLLSGTPVLLIRFSSVNLHAEGTGTVPLAAIFEIHSLCILPHCSARKTYRQRFFEMGVQGPKRRGALWCTARRFLKMLPQALSMHDSLGMAQGWKLCLCWLLPAGCALSGALQQGLLLRSWCMQPQLSC